MNKLNLVKASLRDIVTALQAGEITSERLIERYLAAIERDNTNGLDLRAVITTAPPDKLKRVAVKLDVERKEGKVRGVMHGVPVLIKDAFDVDEAQLGFRTSAGTIVLLESEPKGNAAVVQLLIDAGAIVLGTTNMSILACGIGTTQPWGWSPRGGQTKSAFGPGLHVATSSSGCAVALSAGWAAAAVAEETNASINGPANCAGLFALKPTAGTVPRRGVVPISSRQDSLGPMGKTAWDVAATLSAIAQPATPADYLAATEIGLKRGVSGYRVGVLGAGHPCTTSIFPDDHALRVECEELYSDALERLQPAINPIDCAAVDELVKPSSISDAPWAQIMGCPDDCMTFGDWGWSFDAYAADLKSSKVKTLEDLIEWNNQHPDLAFHPDAGNHPDRQTFLDIASQMRSMTDEYASAKKQIMAWRKELLDYLDEQQLDLIVLTAGILGMSASAVGAATVLPVGSIPIGQLSSGHPIGLFVVGRPHAEETLLGFMAAAEQVVPSRAIPKRMIAGGDL